MQESGVTVAGQLHPLPDPFMVLATQNPIEMEGTYPLPEAQLDRFLLKVLVPYPDAADLAKVVDRTMGRDQPHAPRVHERVRDHRDARARARGRGRARSCATSP